MVLMPSLKLFKQLGYGDGAMAAGGTLPVVEGKEVGTSKSIKLAPQETLIYCNFQGVELRLTVSSGWLDKVPW